MEPLVSIIMPVHNAEKYIKETICSVLSQTYSNFELICVNDHSEDNSIKIIQEFIDDERIKLYNAKKRGAANARKIAISKAKGKYVAFLDSDDIWTKDKLEKQINFMEKNNVYFTYTPYTYIDDNSESLNVIRLVPKSINYISSLMGCRIGCLTVIYNQEVCGKIQTANLKKRNDDILWLTILKKIDKGYRLNIPLAKYRKSNNSLSSGSKLKLLKHHYILYRVGEKMGVLKSVFFVICNIFTYFDVKFRYEKKLVSGDKYYE